MSFPEGKATLDLAEEWVSGILNAAQVDIAPNVATMSPADCGTSNMDLALRGLELKTLDPYLAGWRCRVVPALGHFPVRMITNGAVDRTVHGWIADERSRSTVTPLDPVIPNRSPGIRKGGTGFLRYRLRPAKTQVGTTGFEPATP
ncbi:hypothetical protein ACIQVO_04550 [Streptomyces sp. NPDC101062]|uniref:hypothetical protein n=1 Tax=unclassified Streptomyces TaxID=2593676 RepID=UPI0037FDD9A7